MHGLLVLFLGMTAQDSMGMTTAGYWSYGRATVIEVDTVRNVYFLGVGGSVWGYWYAPGLTRILDLPLPYEMVTGLHYDAGSQRLYIAAGPLITVNLSRIDSPAVQSVYWTPGRVYDVTSRGDTVFLVDGDSLRVLDMTDPQSPQTLAVIGGKASYYPPFVDVEVWGTALYYASPTWLRVVDITDPASPVQTDSLQFMGHRLRVENGWLYTLDQGTSGHYVHGLDLTDPLHPVEAWTLTSGYLTSMDVRDTLLVVTHSDATGLKVYRLSNPTAPVFLGSAGEGVGLDVHLHETSAYIAAPTRGIVEINLTDPAAPVFLRATEDAPGALQALDQVGNLLYVGTDAGLYVLDVGDPANPALVGSLRDTVRGVQDVDVVGDYAYLCRGGNGLTVVNVTAPASPVVETTLLTGGGQILREAVALGTYLYVMDTGLDSLYILDLSTPFAPSVVGSVLWTWLQDMDLEGSLLYGVAWGDPFTGGVMSIWDLSSPTQPTMIVNVTGVGSIGRAVSTEGSLAYFAGENSGVILDVSDPANPAVVWSYNPSTTTQILVRKAWGKGHIAFFSQTDGLLRAFDVSDSSSPVEVGFYQHGTLPTDVVMDSIWMFVARGTWGLQVLAFPALAVAEGGASSRVSPEGLRVERVGNRVVLHLPRDGNGFRVRVLDGMGRQREIWNLQGVRGGRVERPLPPLPPGIYILRVEGARRTLSLRWFVP